MGTLSRVTLAAVLTAGIARASEDACRADVERLCEGIQPGGGRVAACLQANRAQLSPGCKAQLESVSRKVNEVGEACADDVASYCAGVKTGRGAVLRCLQENKANLSSRCQDVLQGAREKAAEFRKACGKDVRKLCKGVAPGEGRILACLESRRSELSPRCQALMGP